MQEIDVEQLERALRDGAQLVDVREPGEFAVAHVPGAVLIPKGELAERLAELDTTRPIYLICASGGRSRALCRALLRDGVPVVNVAGGMSAWIRSGRPVERGL